MEARLRWKHAWLNWLSEMLRAEEDCFRFKMVRKIDTNKKKGARWKTFNRAIKFVLRFDTIYKKIWNFEWMKMEENKDKGCFWSDKNKILILKDKVGRHRL